MDRGEAFSYARQLEEEITSIASPTVREKYEAMSSQTAEYQDARKALLGEVAVGLKALHESAESPPPPESASTDEQKATRSEILLVLSPEEKAAKEWAIELWKNYHQPIREKKASKRRAAEIRRENQLSKTLSENTPSGQHMAYDRNLLLESFYDAWPELAKQHPPTHGSKFIDTVIKMLNKEVRTNWETVPADTMRRWVQLDRVARATLSEDQQPLNIFGRLLKEYFAAPLTSKDRIAACANFSEAMLDFIPEEDRESLKHAAKILNFETDIILFGSPVCETIFAFRQVGFGDLDTYVQAVNTLKTALRLHVFCFGTTTANIEPSKLRGMVTEETFIKLCQQIYFSYSRHTYTPTDAEYLQHTLSDPSDVAWIQQMSETEYEDAVISLPGDDDPRVRSLNDALYRGCNLLGRKLDAYIGHHFGLTINPREFPVLSAIGEVASVPLRDGIMLDVLVPAGLDPQTKEDLMYTALRASQDLLANDDKVRSAFSHLRNANFCHVRPVARYPLNTNFLDYPVLTQLRERVKADDVITHDLTELGTMELPEPVLPEGKDLITIIPEMTTKIKEAPSRFVGKRGIRFPLTDPLLSSRGLQHIDMKRTNDKILTISLKRHSGKPIVFHAAADTLDVLTDGRHVHLAHETAKLWYLCLSMLGEWMNRSAVESSEGLVEEGHEAPLGIGYFSYLRITDEGKKYRRSDEQWYACLDEQNRDLDEISEKRALRDPTGKARNSTYYRERVDDRIDREPLVVYIEPPAFQATPKF